MPFRCCHSLRVGARWARHPRWLRPPAPPQPPIRRVRRRWVIKLLPRHRQWVSIVKYLQLPCDKVEQGDLILAGSIAAGFALGAKNRLLRPSRRAVVSPCFQCPKMASRCRLTLSTAGRIGSRSPLLNAPASARTHARHAGNFHRVPVAVRNAYDRCDSRHIAQANSVIRGLSCPCSPCCAARSVPRSGSCAKANASFPTRRRPKQTRNAQRGMRNGSPQHWPRVRLCHRRRAPASLVSSCSNDSASPSVAGMSRKRAGRRVGNGTCPAPLHAWGVCPCPALE